VGSCQKKVRLRVAVCTKYLYVRDEAGFSLTLKAAIKCRTVLNN
jgi:hypothetical protein